MVQVMVCRQLRRCRNQHWLIVNWFLTNKFQCNSKQNTNSSLMKMNLKMSPAKWRLFCPGVNELPTHPPAVSVPLSSLTSLSYSSMLNLFIHHTYRVLLPPSLDLLFPDMQFTFFKWDNKPRKSFRSYNPYTRGNNFYLWAVMGVKFNYGDAK